MSDKRFGSVRRQCKIARSKMEMICHYCNKEADSIDHIVPYILSRCSRMANLVPACMKCNVRKGHKRNYCNCARCSMLWALFDSANGDLVLFGKYVSGVDINV